MTRIFRNPSFKSLIMRSILVLTAALAAACSSWATPESSAQNPAIVSSPQSESWWLDRHNAVLAAVKAHPDTQLLMIGDSITNNYDKSMPPDQDFQPIWEQFYAPRKALNVGFSGDTTGQVLWRLDHGEVEGLHPKVAVVLIGTNNTGSANQTAEQTEGGIDAVVGDLEQRLPQTHILLLGLLPSGISADKTARDEEVNRHLAACYSEDPRVSYLDIGTIYLSNNLLNADLFYDPRMPYRGKPLHPDTFGQRRMAEAIEPTLAKLMNEPPREPRASMNGFNTAVIPVPQIEQDSYDWFARHHAELELARKLQPQVVLIGDSITHFWGGQPLAGRMNGPAAWQKLFGDTPVLNLGFGWDRTQNVLWRLRQGEFDGLAPRWIVLNIGTNNLTGTDHARANTPEEIDAAIAVICAELHRRSPQSHIVLMAIFPRGPHADDYLRAPIRAANKLLAKRFAMDSAVTYLDIGSQFLEPDGTLPSALMPDGTHPSEAGYRIWAEALQKATGIGR